MNQADHIFSGGACQGEDESSANMGSLTLSQFSVKFETDAFTLDLPTQHLQVDLDSDGERILFRHPNFPGWTIYTREMAILQHRSLQRFGLRARLDDLKSHEGENKHARRVYFALGGLAAFFGALWLGSDLILGTVVNMMPSDWEQKVGNAGFSEMSDDLKMTTEPTLTNRVHLVAERLKKGLPYGAPKFKFHVADEHFLNAVAFPSGDVVVMRGLLEDATPDELAGVLAHEMSHVIEKHGMRAIAQTIGPILIVKYVFGGDSALAALTAGAAMLSGLEYSRSNERDADSKAWDILVNANIDPRGLTSFFRKMRASEGKHSGASDILSTHPATTERIQSLENRWKETKKKAGFQPVNGGPDPEKTEPKSKFPF